MSKQADLKQISKQLGFSVSTVSRILNGKAKQYRISQKTIDMVLNYANQIGYSPNLIAKGLQASKTFTIGLIIPDIANPFFAYMSKSIEKAASDANYSILLADAEESIDKENCQIKNMVSRKVDGLIVAPVGTEDVHFKYITDKKIPLIFIDRYFENSKIPYITSNNYKGSFDATNLFITNGHRNIALIKGDGLIEPVKQRLSGFIDAHTQSGIKIYESNIIGDGFSVENGKTSTLKLLDSDNPPTAILAMSNLIGLGVLEAAKQRDIIIPKQLSLIVYDDQPYVSFLNPPITTVKQNSDEIGRAAVQQLLNLITNNLMPKNQIIETTIIKRDSVSVLG